MTLNVTRKEMVHWMESDGNARIVERPRLSWARLNTHVCDQGSGEIQGITQNFHLFEAVLSGCHDQEIDTNLEPCSAKRLRIHPGSVQLQSSNVKTKLAMEGNQTFHQVLIDDSFFRDAWGAMHKGDPAKFETLSFYGIHDDPMRRNALALLDEARMPTAGGELYAETLAQQIALQVLRRQNARAKKAHSTIQLSNREVDRVVAHMQATLDNPGGLETLAKLVDMDTFAFIRAFKATTGAAPHAYLIELRMIAIKEQLAHSKNTLADIAYGTGFSSQSHMTTAFGKRMGMSPGRYRKTVRG